MSELDWLNLRARITELKIREIAKKDKGLNAQLRAVEAKTGEINESTQEVRNIFHRNQQNTFKSEL